MVPSARKVSTPRGTSSTLLPCHGWSGDFSFGAVTTSSARRMGHDEPPGMTAMSSPPATPPPTS